MRLLQFLKFTPRAFFENLPVMGKGMLGIFVVIGIIILITLALNSLTSRKK